MVNRNWAIGISTRVMGLVIFIGMQSAEAKQCSVEMPSNPPRHWSYRLIDGRKCWYEGENNFPKALLQWPDQTQALSAFDKMDPPQKDLPAQPQTMVPQAPNDQPDSASFEGRWRALAAQLRN